MHQTNLANRYYCQGWNWTKIEQILRLRQPTHKLEKQILGLKKEPVGSNNSLRLGLFVLTLSRSRKG